MSGLSQHEGRWVGQLLESVSLLDCLTSLQTFQALEEAGSKAGSKEMHPKGLPGSSNMRSNSWEYREIMYWSREEANSSSTPTLEAAGKLAVAWLGYNSCQNAKRGKKKPIFLTQLIHSLTL